MTVNRGLREINDEIFAICQTEGSAERTDADLQDALDRLRMERDQKLENIGEIRLEQKAQVKTLEAEIKRLQEMKRQVENRGKRLDRYCMAEMIRAGIRTFTGRFVRMVVCKSPTSAEVVTNGVGQPVLEAIDAEFVEPVVTHKIRRADAIEHWRQTGEAPQGFTIRDDKQHLRVS